MPEWRSDRAGPKEVRFRAVFTDDALGADSLDAAGRLFARWVVRSFAARNPETPDPALDLTPGHGRDHADGAAPAHHVGRIGRTERTHST